MVRTENQPPKGRLTFAGLLVLVYGALLGAVVTRFTGANLLVPGFFGLLSAWLLFRIARGSNKPLLVAASAQSGHAFWFLLGMVWLQQFDHHLVDFTILIVGALLLAVRPSALVIALLACYQAFGILVNANAMTEVSFGSSAHRALATHLGLRALSLIFLLAGYLELRRSRKASVGTVETHAPDEALDGPIDLPES